MNLYELSDSYKQIQQLIEDGAEGLEDALLQLNDAIEEKAVNYAKVIRNLESQSAAIKDEEKRLYERRKSLENNVKRMKESLYDAMKYNDKKKIKTDLFSFNIQNNPPSLSVLDDSAIPQGYWIAQDPKLNKKEIMNDIKQGVSVEGVEVTQGESLRIR